MTKTKFLLLWIFLSSSVSAAIPSEKEASSVCGYVEKLTLTPHIAKSDPSSENRALKYFIKYGYFDINNDGIPENVEPGGMGGSMGGDAINSPNYSGKNEITQQRFEWKDYWTFGIAWMIYGNKTYKLNFTDQSLNYIRFISYIDEGNMESVVCEFDNEVTEQVDFTNKNDYLEFCDLFINGQQKNVSIIQFDIPQKSESEIERAETSFSENIAMADINNDGKLEKIVKASYDGSGCEYTYFDLLSEDAKKILDGKTRDLLLQSQNVFGKNGFGGSGVPSCHGSSPSILKINNEYFIENKYKGDSPSSPQSEFHTIYKIKNDSVNRVCNYNFTIKPKLLPYAP